MSNLSKRLEPKLQRDTSLEDRQTGFSVAPAKLFTFTY